MIKARNLTALLAIGALAATPAFAVGGGANWNTGFQPTFNHQAYGNQGPTGRGATAQPASPSDNGAPAAGKDSPGPQAGNSAGVSSANAAVTGNAKPVDASQQAQQQLQRLGLYHGSIDGKWGPETRRAMAAFQSQNGLPATGTLNFATAQRLGIVNGPASALGNGNAQSAGNNANPGNANPNPAPSNDARRYQGRIGAATAPGYATAPGRSTSSFNATSTTPGGIYGNDSIALTEQPGANTNAPVATNPPGFFGYGNMSNGFNAATGRNR